MKTRLLIIIILITTLIGISIVKTHLGPEPPSKLIIELGEPVNNQGLLPITTTQVITNAELLYGVTVIDFKPTDYGEWGPNDSRINWDVLPRGLGIFQVSGESGIPVTIMFAGMARSDDLHLYDVSCNTESVKISSGHPMNIPIIPWSPTIFVKYSDGGLLPVDGKYTIRYASFYEQEFVLPENAILLSSYHEDCSVNYENFTDANYDVIVFELESEKQNYIK